MRAAGMVQTPRPGPFRPTSPGALRPGPRRRQHQELERPLGCDRGLEGSHGREGVRHRAVRQRPHVLDDGLLPPERLREGVARRVVRPVDHRDRPLHHGADPLPYPPRGLRLVVLDRGQDRQRVGRGYFGHGHRPDARERIGALHGESHRSPNYFSNRMPRTISTKPDYSVRWWGQCGCTPPPRNAFDILTRMLEYRFRSRPPEGSATVVQTDARRGRGHVPGARG